MTLKKIGLDFSVCKITTMDHVDFSREFVFFSKTDDELSLVCETDFIPINAVQCESGWQALKIMGILDFSMVGVIAKISDILAKNGIGLFVISTYNTDYILIKQIDVENAVRLLKSEGYEVISS